jgi:hypothetical protein
MLLIWWYTTGLLDLYQQVREHLRSFAHSLNLDVLTRYLFVPMYGYNDIGSRAISFAVRLVQLIVVSIVTFIYLVVEVIVMLVWLVLPIVIVANIFYQLFGYLW